MDLREERELETLCNEKQPINPKKEAEYFDELKKWISRNLIFDTGKYNDSYLKRRLISRMFAHRIEFFGCYYLYLKKHPEEIDILHKHLTVNVTNFFRNPEMFEAIKKDIFPIIFSKNNNFVKIWSAGCSSGEETYSLAIIAKDYITQNKLSVNLEILGTDIDKPSLDIAKKGIYKKEQLSSTTKAILTKYFSKEGDNYKINEDIKKMVIFKRHDLFFDRYMIGYYDLILCRNVVIYFTKDAKEKLYEKFYKALKKEGYLILGKSEIITGSSRTIFKVVNANQRIYQKT
jgi:chemotaxis protein methyltransferase CheR